MDLKNKKWIKPASIFLLVLFCLVPVIWFIGRPGILIDGSDTNFPLNPLIWFNRRFFVWNDVSNAGTNFASSIAGIFFHLVQLLPYLAKLNLQGVELASLIFWFSMVVFGGYIFSKVLFPEKILPRIVFVLLYTFNIYLFNSWENVKVANLALVATLPISISILVAFVGKKIKPARAIFYSMVVGVLASGSGINPGYFLTILLGILITALVQSVRGFDPQNLKKVWLGFLIVVGSMIIVNSFWTFPTAEHLFLSDKKITSISDIGYTNWLDSLSENTSLVNVLRLQGAWDWYAADDYGAPLYIPYSVNYFRNPIFIIFSFALTGAVFTSFIFRRENSGEYYLIFGTMLVLGVFFGAGGHVPTGVVYKFLSAHLPFFSFFRSPWYIFTPLTVLAVAGLAGLLFEIVSRKVSENTKYLILAGIIISNLLYNYPLVTGKIFRPASKDNFYINFPNYVFDAGKWLSDSNAGRVIGYPDDEIERFDWGYNAVESVLSLVSNREVIFSSLSDIEAPVPMLTRQFFDALKKGEVNSSLSIASKLGVGLILDKTDQSSLAPELPSMIKALSSTTFGKWIFYSIPQKNYLPKIYSSNSVYFSYPLQKSDLASTAVSGTDLVLSPSDSVINSAEDIKTSAGAVVVATNSLDDEARSFLSGPETFSSRIITKDLSKAAFSFNIPEDGSYEVALENYKLSDFGISAGQELNVKIDGKDSTLVTEKTDDSYVYFKPMSFDAGDHQISINLEVNNVAKKIDVSTSGQNEKDAIGIYQITNFDPMSYYFISTNYRYISGDYPSLVVEQRTKTDPVKRKTEMLPRFPENIPFGFYFEPVKTDSVADIFVETPFRDDPLGTRIEYNGITINKVFSDRMILIRKPQVVALAAPNVNFQKDSAVEYSGKVTDGDKPHLLIFSENYSPDWQLTVKSADGSQILTRPLHFSANLYANGWYLAGMPKDYTFKIFYKPQQTLYLGAGVSGLFIVSSIGYLIWEEIRKRNE